MHDFTDSGQEQSVLEREDVKVTVEFKNEEKKVSVPGQCREFVIRWDGRLLKQ